MAILQLVAAVLDAVLLLVAMLAILKLPELLERQNALQQQTAQQLRELLAEVRKVTSQQ